MPTSRSTMIRTVWDQQSVWSAAADTVKRNIGRARGWSLALIIAAAILGAAEPPVSHAIGAAGAWCALAAGIAVGVLPLIRGMTKPSHLQTWARLRSVSETFKAEAYTFLAGVSPYRADDAEDVLAGRIAALLRSAEDLLPRIAGITPKVRPVPAVSDVASYVELRVRAQINEYYRPRAATLGQRARLAERLQIGLSILAVVVGAVATARRTDLGPWVGVVGTVSGAVIAHASAARYAFGQLEYMRTAQHLDHLVGRYERHGAADATVEDAFVADCERIISIQNEAWMAEVVVDPSEGGQPNLPLQR